MMLLVTGARGFVGRGLLPRLAAAGHAGVAVGREPPRDLPAGWTAAPRAEVLAGSLPGPVDAIVHLEVKQHVPRPSPADVEAFDTVNVGGTRDWLVWAEKHGVDTFVHLSTIKAVVAGKGPTDETAPAEVTSPYGSSKARAEAEVLRWASMDPSRMAVILRPAPVYGPGNEANLAAFVRQILAGKPCLIGAGDTRKSIVSRTNLAAAIEFALSTAATGCTVYSVSDPTTPTLAELAAMIADLGEVGPPRRIPGAVAAAVAPVGDAVEWITGRSFPLTSARLRAIRETTVFPCDRLVNAGFRHPQTTREGLAEMVAWASGPET
ncbi:MAG: NAD-dependent epimerase/dehydratase family protein [Planctomycetaceae bacterium]